MHISIRIILLSALSFVCICSGWQGTGAYDYYQVGGDAGRAYAMPPLPVITEDPLPQDTDDEAALSLPGSYRIEPGSPHMWVAERLAAVAALSGSGGQAPVIVAVLDTGIQIDHEDLGGRVIGSVNFTDSPTTDDVYGHGTHVAGIIAATAGNNLGIDGVAPESQLLNVKVADDQGKCRMPDLAAGIVWAVDNGAQVINISIQMHQTSSVLEEALAYARENGVIVIAAAGNNGNDIPVYPAGYADCIGVTAFGDDGELAPLANYGDWVEAAAPGCNIYSLLPGDSYGYKYGTSFATAYVSGLAARLLAVLEDTSGDGQLDDEIRQAINKTCGYGALVTPGKTVLAS